MVEKASFKTWSERTRFKRNDRYLFVKYLFGCAGSWMWLARSLVVACGRSCSLTRGGTRGPPASGVWSPSHWTTRDVPVLRILVNRFTPHSGSYFTLKSGPSNLHLHPPRHSHAHTHTHTHTVLHTYMNAHLGTNAHAYAHNLTHIDTLIPKFSHIHTTIHN